jgi:hypothetical protein
MNSNKVAKKKKAIREAKLAAKEAGTHFQSKHRTQVAHHEAAHVIAHLHHGLSFKSVHIFPDCPDGECGRVDEGSEKQPWVTLAMLEQLSYAGIVSDSILQPEKSYEKIINGTGRGDMLVMIQKYAVAHPLGKEPTPEQLRNLFIEAVLEVEDLVKGHWEEVKTIAFALLASPALELSYSDCLSLLPHYQTAADEYKERARVAIEQRDAATVTA